MSDLLKNIPNSYSTSGAGFHFENRVQASFVVLMLTSGFAPCMPVWPIYKIKLQAQYQGYGLDDLVVFVKCPDTKNESKLLCQVKRAISVKESDKQFQDFVFSAWQDFNNSKLFTKNADLMALITGPLSNLDTTSIRGLLSQAQHAVNAQDFISRITTKGFTSKNLRKKLSVFKNLLKQANNGVDLSDDQIWDFLKHIRLLIYDIDIKGVVLALLHTVIAQFTKEDAESIWLRIKDFVEWTSEGAKEITLDNIPEEIKDIFKRPKIEFMPEDMKKSIQQKEKNKKRRRTERSKNKIPKISNSEDFNYKKTLAFAFLIGSWNESNGQDKALIHKLTGEEYSLWIDKIRAIEQKPDSPLILKNGIWTIKNRKELWGDAVTAIYDEQLDLFKECALAVLAEEDPQFDLPKEERYMAAIHGKKLKYSDELRNGIAEGLALIGSKPKAFKKAKPHKAESIAKLTIRDLFKTATWKLWGSLNDLLPILAEADPEEFIKSVNSGLKGKSSLFGSLFAEEGTGFTGRTYTSGLLWALENAAWSSNYLLEAASTLAILDTNDPGGQWSNRPLNSLVYIFLPWLPQTKADKKTRISVLKYLKREYPDVAWKLLLKLLPDQTTTSSGTYKPKYRDSISDDNHDKVSMQEFKDVSIVCSELILDMAKDDLSKLRILINNLEHLYAPHIDILLKYLQAEKILASSDKDKALLWNELLDNVSRHRCYKEAQWALPETVISKIESVAKLFEPQQLLAKYQRLFSSNAMDSFDAKMDFDEQERQLEIKRLRALNEIIDSLGTEAIGEFVNDLENPYSVGLILGKIDKVSLDTYILPAFLNEEVRVRYLLASGFIVARYKANKDWLDTLSLAHWRKEQVALLLVSLPFTKPTWDKVAILLEDEEHLYWTKVNGYLLGDEDEKEIDFAFDKLLSYSRPDAVIRLASMLLHKKRKIEPKHVIKALLEYPKISKEKDSTRIYDIVDLIKFLQNASGVDQADLSKLEWLYLEALDGHVKTRPKILEDGLANSPEFFCDAIQKLYVSDKEDKKSAKKEDERLVSKIWKLFHIWRTVPGTNREGVFSQDDFTKWLQAVIEKTTVSGYLKAAMHTIGSVLIYSPVDPSGLWIHKTIAQVLDDKDYDEMRNGYRIGVLNARGVHWIDPGGKPEKELAENYRKKADELDSAGFPKFATTLRDLADSYDREAEDIISEHTNDE